MAVAVIKSEKCCQLQFFLCSLKNVSSPLRWPFYELEKVLIKEISLDSFLVNTVLFQAHGANIRGVVCLSSSTVTMSCAEKCIFQRTFCLMASFFLFLSSFLLPLTENLFISPKP